MVVTIEMTAPTQLLAPRYSLTDAAVLARVPRPTTRRWFTVYVPTLPNQRHRGPFRVDGEHTKTTGYVSFFDLLELYVVGRLRQQGWSYPRIRDLVADAQQWTGETFPFAAPHALSSWLDRKQAPSNGSSNVASTGSSPSSTLPDPLRALIESLDVQGGYALRWWPNGKDGMIVIDPDLGWGWSTIARRGIRTELVLEQALAGESDDSIEYSYGLTRDEVRAALDFERSSIAA